MQRTSCVAPTTARNAPEIGHSRQNEGRKGEPFGLRAAWLRFASELELRRLAVLQIRITRKEQSLAAMRGERATIMNRCIRRMRRAAGKQ
ncbi:hypothetical protein SDC9_66611 [bioreactor metagenome]|uniref:Uncharacterized protein n=1 Tax=bioreactor metagenome TaxID=1076179 RepID=A0A644XVD7_9ZZZZ